MYSESKASVTCHFIEPQIKFTDRSSQESMIMKESKEVDKAEWKKGRTRKINITISAYIWAYQINV